MPTCLNCGTFISENFCPNCGQKKDVEKLTWHSLIEEIFHFFSHIEKGFLNTSFKLLIRPDIVIGEYLEGKRKKYFKPLSLFLIWVTIHFLVFELTRNWMHYEYLRTNVSIFKVGDLQTTFIVKHNNIIEIHTISHNCFFIVADCFPTRAELHRNRYCSIYMAPAILILIILQIIITGLLFKTNFLTNNFVTQISIVNFIWIIYCLVLFFRKKRIKYLIPRILLVLIAIALVDTLARGLIAELILKMQH